MSSNLVSPEIDFEIFQIRNVKFRTKCFSKDNLYNVPSNYPRHIFEPTKPGPGPDGGRAMTSYEEYHKRSIEDKEGFWAEVAEKLHWYKKWDKVLDDSNPPFYKWFVGGKTNLCYNAVDRWALGKNRARAAYIYESPETGVSRTITYYELYKEVNKFAGVLKNLDVKKGDRIIIYMPMIPEACIAALSTVRIGAIHGIVFAGFSHESLAQRIDDAQADVVICSDGSSRGFKKIDLKSIVDKALDTAEHPVKHCIVLDRGLTEHTMKEGRDQYWDTLMKEKSENYVEPEQMDSTDPSYILYTSGTTGTPKGIVRDTGGYMTALYHSVKSIYDANEEDIFWAASDIGWVVGHSYIIYAQLLAGVTSIIYEGTPIHPDPGVWFRLLEKYGVNVLFTAPTVFRILRKYDESQITGYDLSQLRRIYLAGEPLDPATYEWGKGIVGDITIIDNYWQTETGWPILSNCAGVELLPIKPGSPTKGAWGWDLAVVDAEGNELEPDTKGYLVAKPPTPPGVMLTIWGDDARYKETYYEQFDNHNYFNTGDYAIMDKDGYYYVLGRADEVINVAGHRLGTRELEEVINEHVAVAEVCVIGVKDEVKGEVPVSMVVLKDGYKGGEELDKELKMMIREKIGAIASPKELRFVVRLPKTRSGKVMRRVIKALFEGEDLGDLSTIEDGASVEEIKAAIEGISE